MEPTIFEPGLKFFKFGPWYILYEWYNYNEKIVPFLNLLSLVMLVLARSSTSDWAQQIPLFSLCYQFITSIPALSSQILHIQGCSQWILGKGLETVSSSRKKSQSNYYQHTFYSLFALTYFSNKWFRLTYLLKLLCMVTLHFLQ